MILLLGGTKDSREIAKGLLQEGYPVVGTVTTPYGKKLLEENKGMKVYCTELDESSFCHLILKEKITLILDATHPYATEISKLAMKISTKSKIPYMRFERGSLDHRDVIAVKDISQAAEFLEGTTGNILITTGSKNLKPFVNNIERDRLYARVLPTPEVIEKCNTLGIDARHIIGMQGPFGKELNQAFYKQYDIQYMVTKESGKIGGTPEKIQGALELGIKVLLIQKPSIEYPKVFHSIDQIINTINKEEKHSGQGIINCGTWE